MELYQVVEAARHGQMWGDLKRRVSSRSRRDVAQAGHREIVAALRARDAEQAAEAMPAHIARVADDLLRSARAVG